MNKKFNNGEKYIRWPFRLLILILLIFMIYMLYQQIFYNPYRHNLLVQILSVLFDIVIFNFLYYPIFYGKVDGFIANLSFDKINFIKYLKNKIKK